jgi:multidrug efflux pump subunit AcrB
MVEGILFFVGLAAHIILSLIALYALIFVPLLMAHLFHPDRKLAIAPSHWLRMHFSEDMAFQMYLIICCAIWAVLMYAEKVSNYIYKEAIARKSAT